jgi:membrane protease YdiL (CAAX protease family)
MGEEGITTEVEKPLLQRVVDFPLVALVVSVALFLLASTLGLVLGKLVAIGQPADTVADAAITIILVLATYKLAIARLGERPRDDLRGRGSPSDLGKGVAAGILLFSAVVGLAALLGVYRVTARDPAAELLVPLVSTAIMPAFTEELLFRGIIFRWLEEFAGSWAALIITSALFGLGHILNPGATWFSSVAVAVEGGLLLGGVYMLTRSLWMAIGLHAAWSFTQGFVFDVPVSGHPQNGLVQAQLSGPDLLTGGDFGLEASVIAMAICAVTGLWFVRRAVSVGKPVQPSWVRRRAYSPSED